MRARITRSLAVRGMIAVGIFAGLAAATAVQPKVNRAGQPTAQDVQVDRRRIVSNPVPSVAARERLLNQFGTQAQAREASLSMRAETRAFSGAPPVVPHELEGTTLEDCIHCHDVGKRSGRNVARKMSHTSLVSCTQCHVEQTHTEFGEKRALAASSFAGLQPGGIGGGRAYEGAPPLVPHQTLMRTNCNSCHGSHGYEGFRTDHSERLNCIQCHAIGAEFDQLAPTFNIPVGQP